MNEFVTYGMLMGFTTLATIVYQVVNFTKELPKIKEMKTKYYSWIVSFMLIVLANIYTLWASDIGFMDALVEFGWNVPLYALSAILVSLTANGASDSNNPVDKTLIDK